jgi:small subunit ribosomal protein S17
MSAETTKPKTAKAPKQAPATAGTAAAAAPAAVKAPEPAPEQAQTSSGRARVAKERIGQVVSDKMNKTIVVKVVRRVPHLKFKKIVKVSNKFYVHDEENKAKTGDKVSIRETRPLSRLKRWELIAVLKH